MILLPTSACIPGTSFSRPHAAAGLRALVERWFAELTNRKLRKSARRSVTQLENDIRKWNKDPKPFVWTKTADGILDTLAAYCRLITDRERP